MVEGYLIVATGSQKYYDMAAVCAASLKIKDPGKPVALVHDDGVTLPDDVNLYFDHLCRMTRDPRYVGCMNKLRIFDMTPFTHTMFVDADCILLSTSVEEYWSAYREKSFVMFGANRVDGRIVGKDVGVLREAFGLESIPQFHVPNYFFTKDPLTQSVFARANDLFLKNPDMVSSLHNNMPGQYADEPFLAVALGEAGIKAVECAPCSRPLLITTWRARHFQFDFDADIARFEKPSRYILPSLSLLPIRWESVNPIFVHFTGLKPVAEYQRLSSQVLRRLVARHQGKRAVDSG